MRKSLFVGGAFLAFALTTASGLRSARAEDCQEVLGNNTYHCRVKSNFGSEFEDCFRFTSPGDQSDNFDLFVDGLGQVQGCSCKASGSFNSPDFNASKEFECVTNGEDGFGIQFEGKADGSQLKKGQVSDQFGNSYVFVCKLDPKCSVTFGLTTRTGNPYARP